MSYIHIPVSLFLIFAELLVCLSVSLKQPATAGQFEIHKTFLKTESHKPIWNAVLYRGYKLFYFKPLEGLQWWKVSIPHTCIWQSRVNSLETFLIFANCLRHSLVLSFGKCSLRRSQYCSDFCSDRKDSGSVHHFMFQNTKNTACPMSISPISTEKLSI